MTDDVGGIGNVDGRPPGRVVIWALYPRRYTDQSDRLASPTASVDKIIVALAPRTGRSMHRLVRALTLFAT
ncbi:MAG: hypothetical protein ACQSGP_22820 [Frankia sp.]